MKILNGKKIIFFSRNILVVIITLILVVANTLILIAADTKAPTDVLVDPSGQTIYPGDTFFIDVYCVPGQPVRAFQFSLSFDPSFIQCNSVVEGDIFSGFSTLFNSGTIDNVNGNITYCYGVILGVGNVSDPGSLANVSFTAVGGLGSSVLHLYDVIVLNETLSVSINVVDGSVTIVITDSPPTGCYTWVDADAGGSGTVIDFDGSCSTDDNGVSTYEWDWDNDGTYDYTGGPLVSHDYGAGGSYDCTLRVTDTVGQTDVFTDTVMVVVPDSPPTGCYTWVDADAGGSGTVIDFDGSCSTDDNGVSTYEWDWDNDGTYDYTGGPLVSHDYGAGGSYDCTLRVTDTVGQTDVFTDTVMVVVPDSPPTGCYTWVDADAGGSGTVIDFDGSCSTDDNGVSTYEWDWDNDGTYDYTGGPLVSHDYGAGGSYDCTLRVTDTVGQTDVFTDTVMVVVPDSPPTGCYTWVDADAGGSGTVIDFDGSCSTDDNGVSTYEWDWDNDGTYDYTGGPLVSHDYGAGGSYDCTLRVTDTVGQTDVFTDTVMVVVPDSPPTGCYTWVDADAGGSGTVIDFDGSCSTDDNGVSTYEWDWDNDGTYDYTGGPLVSHDYGAGGSYDCTLRVTDTVGQTDVFTDTVMVVVPDSPPTGCYTWVDADAGGSGTVIDFDGSCSTDDNGVSTYEWDWDNDGTYDYTGGPLVSHDYGAGGSYDCTLRVTDTVGQTDVFTDTVMVVVPDSPPTGCYTWVDADAGGSGTVIDFDGSCSTDDNGVSTYEWDWDNDGTYDYTGGPLVSHDYGAGGSYDCTLRVTDTVGQTDVFTDTVMVVVPDSPPTGCYTWVDADAGGSGTVIDFDGSCSTDDNGVSTYEWDWDNDGTYDYTGGPLVSHDYGAGGSYDCTLRVTDTVGQTDVFTDTVMVVVPDSPPIAPTNPNPVNGATGVSTSPTLSVDVSDPNGQSMNVTFFDASDDSVIGIDMGVLSGGRASITWSGRTYSTTYSWYAVANDSLLDSPVSDTWSFTTKKKPSSGGGGGGSPPMINNNPVANGFAGEPYQGFIDEEIIFDGSDSYDIDGDNITAYKWDFGDDITGNGMITTHTYQDNGTYIVSLTVEDEQGAEDTYITKAIIIKPNNPPYKPIINGSKEGIIGNEYNFEIHSIDLDNDIIKYNISWGDETSVPLISGFLPSGIIFNASHIWNEAGKYTIEISAYDNKTISEKTYFDIYISAVEIEDLGYLIDSEGDTIYDIFYNETNGEETLLEFIDGNYLINDHGDNRWDYIFSESDGLSVYNEQKNKNNDTFVFEIVIVLFSIIVLIICLIIVIVYVRKK